MLLQQVKVVKETDDGNLLQVAWIPKKFASLGNRLELKDESYKWTGPWTVVTVFRETALDEGYVREHQRINLPSIKK